MLGKANCCKETKSMIVCCYKTKVVNMLNSTLTQGFGTISIKECAELLGKPTSTIYSWIRNGDIPKSCYTRIGKCIFILNEPMKKFLNGDM